jgi:myosin-6
LLQNNPKIKAEEITQLHKQLMNQANASMASLQQKLKQQKVAEEQDRLRKIQEEMDKENKMREQEERRKKEEDETRKK